MIFLHTEKCIKVNENSEFGEIHVFMVTHCIRQKACFYLLHVCNITRNVD